MLNVFVLFSIIFFAKMTAKARKRKISVSEKASSSYNDVLYVYSQIDNTLSNVDKKIVFHAYGNEYDAYIIQKYLGTSSKTMRLHDLSIGDVKQTLSNVLGIPIIFMDPYMNNFDSNANVLNIKHRYFPIVSSSQKIIPFNLREVDDYNENDLVNSDVRNHSIIINTLAKLVTFTKTEVLYNRTGATDNLKQRLRSKDSLLKFKAPMCVFNKPSQSLKKIIKVIVDEDIVKPKTTNLICYQVTSGHSLSETMQGLSQYKALSGGYFGSIYTRYSADNIAVKEIQLENVLQNTSIKANDVASLGCEEMFLLGTNISPHIVNFVSSFVTAGDIPKVFIAMEQAICDASAVFDLDVWADSHKLSPTFQYQSMEALQFLHRRGICHRDIKILNFLLCGSLVHRNLKFKLSDVGSAQFGITPGQFNGNLFLAGPEASQLLTSGRETDIFAWMRMIYYTYTNDDMFNLGSSAEDKTITMLVNLFGNYSMRKSLYAKGSYEPDISAIDAFLTKKMRNIPQAVVDVFDGILSIYPQNRYTADDIMNTKYFQQLKLEQVLQWKDPVHTYSMENIVKRLVGLKYDHVFIPSDNTLVIDDRLVMGNKIDYDKQSFGLALPPVHTPRFLYATTEASNIGLTVDDVPPSNTKIRFISKPQCYTKAMYVSVAKDRKIPDVIHEKTMSAYNNLGGLTDLCLPQAHNTVMFCTGNSKGFSSIITYEGSPCNKLYDNDKLNVVAFKRFYPALINKCKTLNLIPNVSDITLADLWISNNSLVFNHFSLSLKLRSDSFTATFDNTIFGTLKSLFKIKSADAVEYAQLNTYEIDTFMTLKQNAIGYDTWFNNLQEYKQGEIVELEGFLYNDVINVQYATKIVRNHILTINPMINMDIVTLNSGISVSREMLIYTDRYYETQLKTQMFIPNDYDTANVTWVPIVTCQTIAEKKILGDSKITKVVVYIATFDVQSQIRNPEDFMKTYNVAFFTTR